MGARPGVPQNTSCSDVPVPDTVQGNAMRGAWRKGYLRFKAGGFRDENPYLTRQTDRGRMTYRRALARCWAGGFDHAMGSETEVRRGA